MKLHAHFLPFLLVLPFVFVACQEEDLVTDPTPNPNPGELEVLEQTPTLPDVVFNYANPDLPAYLTTPPVNGQDNTPANNQVTDAGATLGRVLFYDKNLSANNTVACASCHDQANSFTDPEQFSIGFEGGATPRNSMSLLNARYYPNGQFFWDERAATLEDQTLMPIQDHIEMGMELDDLVAKLEMIEYYPELFEVAFGDDAIDSDRISRALAQFVRSIVSYQSKYDEGRANFPPNVAPGTVDFPNFTAEENRGKEVFFTPGLGGCAGCHGTETFGAPGARNNGLDAQSTDDLGLGGVTGNTQDDGKFKVPSLKGVALTAPFMHDGRFQTLEQVVEHYDNGVQPHPNLDPLLRFPNGNPRQLNLSEADKAALVAFLHTLTDTGIALDEKFSDPFIE
jgi:cytochrome c peroxidase